MSLGTGVSRERSLRSVLDDLQAAFQEGGIPALRKAYHQAEHMSLARRVAFRLVSAVYPVARVLDAAVLVDDRIRELGPHLGCRAALNELGFPWEVSLPPEDVSALRERPLVAYGNHPSLLTPFLVLAALDRPDVRILAVDSVARLVPHLAPSLLSVVPTFDRRARPRLGLGFMHRVGLSLLNRMEPEVSGDAARAQNRRTLEEAVSHVRDGGCIVVCPGGGAPGRWFSGIGALLKSLGDESDRSSILLAPFQEQNCTYKLVYDILASRWPSLRKVARRRPPIRIVFSRPVPVPSILASLSPSAPELTGLLESHYKTLFREAARDETASGKRGKAEEDQTSDF